MATIPSTTNQLRHVRKTIAFDGSANNGNLGDPVTLFTLTGIVLIDQIVLRCTETLVCAAPALTEMYVVCGTVDYITTSDIPVVSASAGRIYDQHGGSWSKIGAFGGLAFGHDFPRFAIADNLVLTVEDLGGGADITDGTLIIDCWYYPVTDDGALAGDDIDAGYTPADVKAWLGTAPATPTVAGVPEVDLTHVAGSTTNVAALATNVDAIKADTEDIQSRLPAALVNGRIDATIDGTGMESGAIDAILTRQMTESYSADGAAPTLAQALFEIMQCLTEFSISGTTITVKKRDGSTTAMTFTLDDATTPTSRTRAT